MSESEYFNDSQHYKETLPEDGPIPKKRSLVWQFFERTNQYRVRCYLCQHEQNYQGTTGNILRHMKAKHDLDLTLKGQQDPDNQIRIKELCAVAADISGTVIKMERKCYSMPSYHKTTTAIKRKQSFDEMHDVNPYEEVEDHGVYPLESYVESGDPFHMNDNSASSHEGERMTTSCGKGKSLLGDERIKAETKYFIEKANYYKLQKHLTALMAKKVKIEIEQLTAANTHNKYDEN